MYERRLQSISAETSLPPGETKKKFQTQTGIPSGHSAQKIVDLNDLRIFAYVASLTSFSLAADALQIHKSSVSRSIARLEAMLKTPLLQRTTRKVLLTQRGVDMRERCVDLLSHVNKAIGYADDIKSGPSGLASRAEARHVNQAAQRRRPDATSRALQPSRQSRVSPHPARGHFEELGTSSYEARAI